jgi:hypothetical protein
MTRLCMDTIAVVLSTFVGGWLGREFKRHRWPLAAALALSLMAMLAIVFTLRCIESILPTTS